MTSEQAAQMIALLESIEFLASTSAFGIAFIGGFCVWRALILGKSFRDFW